MPLPNLDLHNLEEVVLEKCDSFVRLSVWPSSQQLNFRGWIDNFSDDQDRTYALHLLNSFTFYNSELCSALLFGAIQSLSIPHSRLETMNESLLAWDADLRRTIFVPVEGEKPNITDSGIMLAGMVRRRLQIPEDRIKSFDQLLQAIAAGRSGITRVVFFDDFIGSGQQFIRLLLTPRMNNVPYDIILSAGCEIRYCCFVATAYGLRNIEGSLPDAKVQSSHVIDETHSVVAPNSRVWPNELRSGVDDFILRSSRRAGIPDHNRLGFHNLGLALAFDHTIPDASLPIFYNSTSDWIPLMRRT